MTNGDGDGATGETQVFDIDGVQVTLTTTATGEGDVVDACLLSLAHDRAVTAVAREFADVEADS